MCVCGCVVPQWLPCVGISAVPSLPAKQSLSFREHTNYTLTHSSPPAEPLCLSFYLLLSLTLYLPVSLSLTPSLASTEDPPPEQPTSNEMMAYKSLCCRQRNSLLSDEGFNVRSLSAADLNTPLYSHSPISTQANLHSATVNRQDGNDCHPLLCLGLPSCVIHCVFLWVVCRCFHHHHHHHHHPCRQLAPSEDWVSSDLCRVMGGCRQPCFEASAQSQAGATQEPTAKGNSDGNAASASPLCSTSADWPCPELL